MMERASELLDHTGSFAVDLRTREVGQLNLRNASGEGLHGNGFTCSDGFE
jgi:hypothetical protein